MQEKLIKLICSVEDFEENYMCNCGCCEDIMTEFIDDLNAIFLNVDEVKEISSYIKWLNLSVFTDENYKSAYLKDDIRDAIEEVLKSDIEAKKVTFDYDLVYQYIEFSASLINYLEDISLKQLISLASKNPYVLYLIDDFSIDTLKEITKNNNGAALIIDVDVLSDEQLYNTYLYKNRDRFLEDKELYDLYINGLKEALKLDKMKYVSMSKIARNDIYLAKFILNIDPRFIAYTEYNIRNNKDIMLHMLSLDISNKYYLSEELKKDIDIQKILNS